MHWRHICLGECSSSPWQLMVTILEKKKEIEHIDVLCYNICWLSDVWNSEHIFYRINIILKITFLKATMLLVCQEECAMLTMGPVISNHQIAGCLRINGQTLAIADYSSQLIRNSNIYL